MALANTKPIPEDLVSHCPGQRSQNPKGEPGLERDQQTSVYFPVPQTIASYTGCHSQPPPFPRCPSEMRMLQPSSEAPLGLRIRAAPPSGAELCLQLIPSPLLTWP